MTDAILKPKYRHLALKTFDFLALNPKKLSKKIKQIIKQANKC